MIFETTMMGMREGKIATREAWNKNRKLGDICIRIQLPDKSSMNTEPYFVMEKVVDGKLKVFPFIMTAESLFADDWIFIKEADGCSDCPDCTCDRYRKE